MNRRKLVSSAMLGSAGAMLAGTVAAAPADGIVEPSNFARIRSAGVMRIAVLRGQEPYFHKNEATGEWSGAGVAMAKDIARVMQVKLDLVETGNWATQILDVQSGKVDVIFGVSPTPERALVLDLPGPVMQNFYTVVGRKDFRKIEQWSELDKPEITVAVDIGSGQDAVAHNVLPNATIKSFGNHDDVLMGVSTGRLDCCLLAILLAMKATQAVPNLGAYSVPRPFVAAASCMAVRLDGDKRFRDFLIAWANYNRSTGVVRRWVADALRQMGLDPASIPPEVDI